MISLLKSKYSTSSRRALLVSNDKLAVYHWAKNTLGSSYLFDASSEGFEHFARYLREVNNDPVYVLLDTAAEEYRLDTIPHVFGSDRKALLDRKKERLFRGTPYLHADVQGREEGGRRDDNVMFSAVTNPDILEPWLKILETHKVPVAGVISVPLLFQEIPNLIPDIADNALVFSLQSMSGLRQSFFSANALKFSRLVRVPRYGTTPYAPIISEELDKVRRYINSAHLLDESKPLDVYFLGDKELLDELGKSHVNESKVRYHMIDVHQLGEACGINEQVRLPFSDKYFIYQLLKKKSKNYYALSSETRYFQMRQMNKALKVLSVLLVLAGFVWGGLNVLEGFTYKKQHVLDDKKSEFYRARYEVAKERISALSVEPNDLKVVVDATRLLEDYKSEPMAMFQLLGNSLNNFPDVQIEKIQWVANTNPNHELGKGKLKQVIDDGLQGVLGLSNVSDTETGFNYYQIAFVDAYLGDFDGNYRIALRTIEEFSESIRAQESVHDVSVMTLPLDISSDASLQGSASSTGKDSGFSIRIVLGVKNDA